VDEGVVEEGEETGDADDELTLGDVGAEVDVGGLGERGLLLRGLGSSECEYVLHRVPPVLCAFKRDIRPA
jgi:hypothetical protein